MTRNQAVIGLLSMAAGVAMVAIAVLFRARLGLGVGIALGSLLVVNGALRLWLKSRGERTSGKE